MSSEAAPPTNRRIITLASRASKLAQIQTTLVLEDLQRAHPEFAFSTLFMSTAGDRDKTTALATLSHVAGTGTDATRAKSLWTEDLEVALTESRTVDIIVHSLKDVPTVLTHDGCAIAGITRREDPLDAFVAKAGSGYGRLEDLPDGSVVGTGSVRRVAQLRRAFSKLVFQDCRGNLDTRLAKLDAPDGPYAGLILAKAGLVRMDLGHRVTCSVGVPTLYHAVGQGALGLEVRADDAEALGLVRTATHVPTELACRAERACLRVLEGGCSVPVGVSSAVEAAAGAEGAWTLRLTGTVTSIDGTQHVVHTEESVVRTSDDAEAVGEKVAHSLVEKGARAILDAINKERAALQKKSQAVVIEG